ncbi:phage integrase central domain-containing protein [Sphingomonas sp. Root241]|uniref:phage integrase central domain-containing protein n=1 Tax=Sphingomonas sp. Root241 TaxID=1736501 RepID=UPI0039E179D4
MVRAVGKSWYFSGDRDVFPGIGELPVAQLSPPLVMAALREIEARGAIETAKRVRQRISAV